MCYIYPVRQVLYDDLRKEDEYGKGPSVKKREYKDKEEKWTCEH